MGDSRWYGVILAGGRGTRFWPRSRRLRPKQLLNFIGDRSLLQETVARLRPVLPPDRIWVLTNACLRAQVARQLPEIPRKQILAEPASRNTAPCLGLAAHLLHSMDRDAVMGVFPADQVIGKPARFLRIIGSAYRAAAKGGIVVLGIQPKWPETGYGYVEFPGNVKPGSLKPSPVLRFREKPDLETARRYVASGRHYWNSGMFFWRAQVLLEELRRHVPRTATLLASLPAAGRRGFGARLREAFPLCENISIDYAVLEKAGNVVGLAAPDIGWNDVGSWNAVYELLPHDRAGNVVRGEALLEASAGSYVDAPGKLVALLGVRDLVVVDTPGALLVANRARAQEVGRLVKLLEQRKRDDLL